MSDIFSSYSEFITAVTSQESLNSELLIERIRSLDGQVNLARLMTGSDGISSEGGEIKEIVKKILYQGKPLNDETIFHLKRELGDVIFYWFTTALALGLDPQDIILENIRKLESRYPGGKFSIDKSENRADNDL